MIPPKRRRVASSESDLRISSEKPPSPPVSNGIHHDSDWNSTERSASEKYPEIESPESSISSSLQSAAIDQQAGLDTNSLSQASKVGMSRVSKWKPISKQFYDLPCLELCRKLLGKLLVRRLPNGENLVARIVEVEAYLGSSDKSSHSFSGKQTSRNRAMFMDPGHAYVYLIYGMYFCFNISSREPGSCVLIRAAEPLLGLEAMRANRTTARSPGKKSPQKTTKELADKHLCNGPSKLCQALRITKVEHNQLDMTGDTATLFVVDFGDFCGTSDGNKSKLDQGANKDMKLVSSEASGDFSSKPEDSDVQDFSGIELFSKDVADSEIVECPRIGIDGAGEPSVSKLYRFYVASSECVSVKFNPLK